MFGWHPIEDMINGIQEFLYEQLKSAIETCLDKSGELFQKTVTNIQSVVSESPNEFAPGLTESLKAVSDTAIVPLGGLLLTYLFCYEIFNMATDKNKGTDFDTQQILMLIIKTACGILLITNAFTIALAFVDLGQWLVEQVPAASLGAPDNVTENVLNSIGEGEVGTALAMLGISIIILVATFAMSMIVFLVAWSRMIHIFIYVTVAPFAFATAMSMESNWVGTIAQSYIKEMLALMLQGFLMLVTLIVYAGLMEKTTGMIAGEDNPLYALALMLVSMTILVVMLTKTHGLAKRIVGAN